jgi:hypothetical protein
MTIIHHKQLKSLFLVITALLIGISSPDIFAETLELNTNQSVYSPKHPLFIYGEGPPNQPLVVRLFAPDGTTANFEQVMTKQDGSFSTTLMKWQEPSTDIPYGTYVVEIVAQSGTSEKLNIKFAPNSELVTIPIERTVQVTVFAPEIAASDRPFRVFAQVSSDGHLVHEKVKILLAASHVHTPSDSVRSLTQELEQLHEGLYFVEYKPTQEGTYVFHMVANHQGTISHGSAATLVLGQDLAGLSQEIVSLNQVLTAASTELDTLQTDIHGFGTTLESASDKINSGVSEIDTSVSSMSSAVTNIEEASLQVNSLLFPIVGSIAVIVALQITILARRR